MRLPRLPRPATLPHLGFPRLGRLRRLRRLPRAAPHAVLAIVVYVPLLLTATGRVTADTKTYLYLDPGKLLSRAWSTWDPNVGLGTVTHQTIGYLWPMGPWFWVFDRLQVPDWIAQRLWLGTLMFAAGAGVVFLLRYLDWRGPTVTVAAVLYALTPYVLTVAHRISAILLPWAGLPWMIAFCARSVRRGGWRDPALFALTVATVGSVNATALVLAGVGAALWVPFAVWVHREATPRDALLAVGRMGGLTVLTSAWWIAGLWVQGGYGIDIVRYSETAATVASASTAPEVLRGLGYWFFYGGDRLDLWVPTSRQYTQRLWLLGVTYLLPAMGLLGAAVARWHHRAYFAALVVLGTLLAVGAHPWDDPPAFGRVVKEFLDTDTGLAVRSLPRAVPLIALGLAVLTAAGLATIAPVFPRLTRVAAPAVLVLALLGLAPLWQLRLVPRNLDRSEHVPEYWEAAARHVDAQGSSTRILEVPGIDFASYRWGDTVDPITPGLADRPYVARELVPYGSPAAADLLNALDRGLQERVAVPAALAPIARLMSAGTVLARNDLQYERFRTPRPQLLWHDLQRARGLGNPATFGPAVPNRPSRSAPLDDELELVADPSLPNPPRVAAFPVGGAPPIVHGVPTAAQLVVAGNGDGLVDAAEAGLLEGDELILYSASFAERDDELRDHLERGGSLLVTDTNRRRGLRWSTVRDTTGFTEQAGEEPIDDPRDNRLPVFPDDDDTRTVVEHRGEITASATSYGNEIVYVPEDRPANAVDGNPRTAWRTGEFGSPTGERLRLALDEPVTTDAITILQPEPRREERWVTAVRLHFDRGSALDVTLDETSRTRPGQRIRFPERTFNRLEIEITADTTGKRPRYTGLPGVGFAEVRIGERHVDELVRMPTDLLRTVADDSDAHPLAVLMTRLRTDPTNVTRDDEEVRLVREFELPSARSFVLAGTARLSPRTGNAALDAFVAPRTAVVSATSSSRLPGGRAQRAAAVLDGDRATAWTPPFGEQEGQWVDVRSAFPVQGRRLDLTIVADGHHSIPTRLRVVADGRRLGSVRVPTIDDQDRRGATAKVRVRLPRFRASRLRLVIEAVEPVRTTDWFTSERTVMPVGIAEISAPGLPRVRPRARIDTGCRRDLVTVDGDPMGVRISGESDAALAGEPLVLRGCSGPLRLGAGEHVVRAAAGMRTGLDLDQVVLRSGRGGRPGQPSGPLVPPTPDGPPIAVDDSGRARVEATVRNATAGEPFWLVLGQSNNRGWKATVAGDDLGRSELVSGYANGWLVDPTAETFTVAFAFGPQRVVNVALLVSVAAVIACLVIALVSRGGRPAALTERVRPPLPFSWSQWLTYEGTPPSRGVALATVIGLGLVFGVVIGPVAGAVVAGAVAVTVRRARFRWLLTVGSPACMVAAAVYIVVWQVRHDILPGFEWPGELTRVHPVAWLGVALLAADVLVGRLWKPLWAPHDDDDARPRITVRRRRRASRRA